LTRLIIILFFIIIPWLNCSAGEFPFKNNEKYEYYIKCYGLTVGVASLSIHLKGNIAKLSLASRSTGLAEYIVPFRIKCNSIFNIKKNRFTEYRHIVRFKKEKENYIISENNNIYNVYYLLDADNKLLKKYPGLICREKSTESLIALRIRSLSYVGEIYDPLSLLIAFCSLKKNIALLSNNRINIIKTNIEKRKGILRIVPELRLPGILPKGSKGYIDMESSIPRIPVEIRVDAPGFGKFYIYKRR